MRYSLVAVAAASLAVAAPTVNERQVAGINATDAVGGLTGGVTGGAPLGGVTGTPALDLESLLEQLLEEGGGLQFKGEMTQEEMTAMREIEATFTKLRQDLQAIAQGQQVSVTRRQLDILNSLPIVGPLLGSLLGGLGGGGGGGLGGTLGGLTGILGRTRPEDLSVEEMDMMKEAEVLMEEFLREVSADNKNNQQEQNNQVQRRQLDFLFGLPIVGPLLQSLLGGLGGGGGGLGGTLGGVTGTLGGLTGGATGALGGLTGGLTGGGSGGSGGSGGGAGGALGGLTGSLGGLTGGLTGGLDLGGLLGKNPADLKVSEEQMAKAREADAILRQLAEKIEAEGRAQQE